MGTAAVASLVRLRLAASNSFGPQHYFLEQCSGQQCSEQQCFVQAPFLASCSAAYPKCGSPSLPGCWLWLVVAALVDTSGRLIAFAVDKAAVAWLLQVVVVAMGLAANILPVLASALLLLPALLVVEQSTEVQEWAVHL